MSRGRKSSCKDEGEPDDVLAGLTQSNQVRKGPLAVKRALDVVGSIVGLSLALVPCAFIALVIKATSPGPVLYRQERVGRDGCTFVILKFRTMRAGTHEQVIVDREAHREYVSNDFKLPPGDPRITRVGRILRKLSLDEVPQFVNVLRGEMSLVGIRPVERAQLDMRLPSDQSLYEVLRPGLTGSWQIDGRSSAVHHERLELDRAYIANWSLAGDLRILLKTPVVVLRIVNTY